MRFRLLRPVLLAALGGLMVAACEQSYQNIPPNYIGMKLTPTGYEDTIYTPGQVDIGTTSPLTITGISGLTTLVFSPSPDTDTKEVNNNTTLNNGTTTSLFPNQMTSTIAYAIENVM